MGRPVGDLGVPLVLTVATTGSIQGKKAFTQHQDGLGPSQWDVHVQAAPAVAEQPEEIEAEARNSRGVGASILHIHARDKDGVPTAEIGVYEEIVSRVRETTDLVTQVGTGIRSDIPLEDRLKVVRMSPTPEMFTINTGTFHFLWRTFSNPPWLVEKFVDEICAVGSAIEFEIYDLSHLYAVIRLMDAGRIPEDVHFSFVMGIPGGMPARPDVLMTMLQHMPDKGSWQVIGTGSKHLAVTAMGIALGGNARAGAEDTVFYSYKRPAVSSAELVQRLANVAASVERPIATPDQAIELLNLPDFRTSARKSG